MYHEISPPPDWQAVLRPIGRNPCLTFVVGQYLETCISTKERVLNHVYTTAVGTTATEPLGIMPVGTICRSTHSLDHYPILFEVARCDIMGSRCKDRVSVSPP